MNTTLTLTTDAGEYSVSFPSRRPSLVNAIVIRSYGCKKIGVIKMVRAYTGLPLKDVKLAVEALPCRFTQEDLKAVHLGQGADAVLRSFQDDLVGLTFLPSDPPVIVDTESGDNRASGEFAKAIFAAFAREAKVDL